MHKRIFNFLFTVLFSLNCFDSFADEGMWIPSLLMHYNIDIMRDEGLKLTAEDIYSINQACIKDAVVIFGRGCTGVVISAEGLILTNHHCGYGAIQSLSSINNDYLKNGFWAGSRNEELPVKNLSVTFLKRIDDVTNAVLSGLNSETSESQRKDIIEQNIRKIIQDTVKDTHYKAVIKPFFYGNEYYMFIYEEFTDIRLVGTPPASIGSFGADLDNWIWPRHTGDFSMFRVYAGQNNEPVSYSADNVPFKPCNYVKISTSGIDSGDFTMVMGYPGRTTEYLISSGVENIYIHTLPYNIKLREKRMEIMTKHMKASDLVNLQYSAKLKSVSNSWKKWQGMIKGLDKSGVLEIKKNNEEEFKLWVESDSNRKSAYGNILTEMHKLHSDLKKYLLPNSYYQECFMAVEIFQLFLDMGDVISKSAGKSAEDKLLAKEVLLAEAETFFKNYHQALDEEIFAAMLERYAADITPEFHPAFFSVMHQKYGNDYKSFVRKIFKKSSLVNYDNIKLLLTRYPDEENKLVSEILKDPLYSLFSDFSYIYNEKVMPVYEYLDDKTDSNYRLYMQALREKDNNQIFYPDANFTMRLTYGKVEGYQPLDAVVFNYYTTLSGKIEKYKTGNEDYSIPEKLFHLHETQDYGQWADKKTGQLHLCFVASNHTSGGNSGSPVMNSNGHLIGLNFDRNWEGTMSDIMYDPSQCRNISVDIRYIMFIIDKFAGAGYLLDEMVFAD